MLKGGVSKSTIAVNMAVALSRRGRRVLLMDVDAQMSATDVLGLADLRRAEADLVRLVPTRRIPSPGDRHGRR